MTNRVIGPGVTLPPAQTLYPANLWPYGVPYTPGANEMALAPGDSIQLPAGDFFIDLGKYSILEYMDPTQNTSTPTNIASAWRPLRTQRGTYQVRSDGNNYRISNLLGCPVGAIITVGGAAYVQASTTVTPSAGNSTWIPIVGGALDGISLTALGAGYGVAPLVMIPAPPSPGIAATAVATISGGALTGITITTQGAGYTSTPPVTILTNPYDPNFASITAATAAAHLSFGTAATGSLTGLICTNPGVPLTTSLTLTIGGVGHSATATPSVLFTLSGLSFTALGSGTITGAALTTAGGVNSATDQYTNASGFIPRQAQVALALTGSVVTTPTIIDGGMFIGTFTPIFQTYGGVVTTTATVALTAGTANDVVVIQPM